MRLDPVTFCSFVVMRMSLMVVGSGVLMAFQVDGALSSLLRCCRRCGGVLVQSSNLSFCLVRGLRVAGWDVVIWTCSVRVIRICILQTSLGVSGCHGSVFLPRLSAGPILGLIHDHSEQIGWKRGLGNFLQKRTETTCLAKFLQIFFFWKRKKKSIKRLSLGITSLSLSLHEKQLLW